MISRLSTYHDVRAIGIIRAFISETGRFFGADEGEVQQLELAAEEAAGFIISSLLPDRDENFMIACKPIVQGLSFHFENRGLPVDEESLRVYDSKNPSDSMEGLPFFLMESVTDAVQFQNRGNEGWVLVFEKRLKSFTDMKVSSEISPEVLKRCAKEKLSVEIATPEDAYDLIQLTYFTYRYSYVKEIFYYRKALQEAISSGQIIAFIGKNRERKVVINSAFFRSPHCDAIAEAGMLMSRPEYRMNHTLLRLTRKQWQYIKDGKNGLRVMYSKLVTAHMRSQRLLKAYDFVPTALKLSVHDKAEFVGLDTHEKGRESLLYALTAPNGFDKTTLFVPAAHRQITEMLLAPIDVITVSVQTAVVTREVSAVSVEQFQEDLYATVTVENIGKDWLKQVRKHLNSLESDGVITVHLHIAADAPLPQELDEKLADMKLFYSGVVIKTMHRWELVYTLLQGQHFDFASVQLAEACPRALCDYMYRNYTDLKESL